MKNTKMIFTVLVIIVLSLWLASGIYTIDSQGGQAAVVLRFGEYIKTVEDAGLHWHMPAPFETIIKEKIGEVKNIEIGYKTMRTGSTKEYSQYQQNPNASLMFTKDENMVHVEAAIQYVIIDIDNYLFNVDDQKDTLTLASESVIRRAVASHELDEVLTDNKFAIQQEILLDLQDVCDIYKMGIAIKKVALQDVEPPEEVDAAFKDVANAKEDKTSYINQAHTYENEVIPKARGNAAENINQAEAYKEKRIAEAKGDVAKFSQILDKYKLGKKVTRTRLYLETLEEVLPGIKKYIVDQDSGVLKFLPLGGTMPIDDTVTNTQQNAGQANSQKGGNTK